MKELTVSLKEVATSYRPIKEVYDQGRIGADSNALNICNGKWSSSASVG